MGGILGTALGESPADAAARIEEAKKTATDLTGMVRRKAKTADSPAPEGKGSVTGKRKAEDEGDGDSDGAKKAKVEDASDE